MFGLIEQLKTKVTQVLYQLLNDPLSTSLPSPISLCFSKRSVFVLTTGELGSYSSVGSVPEMPSAEVVNHSAVCPCCWVNTVMQVATSYCTAPAASCALGTNGLTRETLISVLQVYSYLKWSMTVLYANSYIINTKTSVLMYTHTSIYI